MKLFYNGCGVCVKNDTVVFIDPYYAEIEITNNSFELINSVLNVHGYLDTDDRIYIQMLMERVYGTYKK